VARGGARASAVQGLAFAAFNNGQIVDHGPIAGRFAGDSHGIAQVPIAEHHSPQMHHTMVDRDLNVAVVEIRIGMQSELHAIPQVGIHNGIDICCIRSCGGAAQNHSQTGTNGRGVV